MSELVLDSSVLVKWFRTTGESDVAAAHAIRAAFEQGGLTVFAPALIFLELLNVAGRHWGWDHAQLWRLSGVLKNLGLEVLEPDLEVVATWTSRGLSAYDAAYVAVAEAANLVLVTSDNLVLTLASDVARPLTSWQ